MIFYCLLATAVIQWTHFFFLTVIWNFINCRIWNTNTKQKLILMSSRHTLFIFTGLMELLLVFTIIHCNTLESFSIYCTRRTPVYQNENSDNIGYFFWNCGIVLLNTWGYPATWCQDWGKGWPLIVQHGLIYISCRLYSQPQHAELWCSCSSPVWHLWHMIISCVW